LGSFPLFRIVFNGAVVLSGETGSIGQAAGSGLTRVNAAGGTNTVLLQVGATAGGASVSDATLYALQLKK